MTLNGVMTADPRYLCGSYELLITINLNTFLQARKLLYSVVHNKHRIKQQDIVS